MDDSSQHWILVTCIIAETNIRQNTPILNLSRCDKHTPTHTHDLCCVAKGLPELKARKALLLEIADKLLWLRLVELQYDLAIWSGCRVQVEALSPGQLWGCVCNRVSICDCLSCIV